MTGQSSQEGIWSGEFGGAYTGRNTFDLTGLEAHYQKLYGIGRLAMDESFVGDLDRSLSILEVGCNAGNQLLCLHQMGFTALSGLELQSDALAQARARLPAADLTQGSAFELPYPDMSFDLVFTSGVLIHIAPTDLPVVLREIHRVSRRYIWGFEYYQQDFAEIPYRGHDTLMWKGPYPELFLKTFADLRCLKQECFDYVDEANRDVMYLLTKQSHASTPSD